MRRRPSDTARGPVPGAGPLAFVLVAIAAGSGCDRQPETAAHTPLKFVERAADLGLARTGPGYSAAAADFDRDGWPDLAVSEHRRVTLHHNEAGSGFAGVPKDRFASGRDAHGITWLDWNADGWPDLYVSHGALRGRGERSNRLYLNRAGERFEASDADGVLGNARGRGRSATPWDLNDDGRLDLMIVNFLDEGRPQRIALSGPGGYRDAAPELGFDKVAGDTVTAFRLTGETAFVVSGFGPDAGRVYRRGPDGRLRDSTGELGIRLPADQAIPAVAVGDVDNDGDDDLYQVRAPRDHQGARANGRVVEFFYARRMGADRPGIRVRAQGRFRVAAWAEGRRRHDHLHLGASASVAAGGHVTVAPGDARLEGAPDLDQAAPGIYIWREDGGEYRLHYVAGDGPPQAVTGRLTALDGGLELVGQSGDRFLELASPNRLYLNEGERFRAVDAAADPGAGQDARLVDFDNDGDLDLFVVNGAHKLRNDPDRLYENRGKGRFVEVTEPAGMAGAPPGRGATTAVLDYDRDGRMDFFVSNGAGPPPRNREGPQQFFRNESTAGNWLRVRLEARRSNPMALGALVTVESEGLRQQRFVNAASGALATSWLPLHFGLGEAKTARVEVRWPSGAVQQREVQANAMALFEEPRAEEEE